MPQATGKASAIHFEQQALIDEFGELDRQLQAFQPTAARHRVLREQIMAWAPDLLPAQATTFSSDLYDLHLTARQSERSIVSMPKVYKAIGKETFLSICSLSLKALEETLGKDRAEAHVAWNQSGPRKLVAVAKASPARATA